jgi:hypothetical protein
MLPGQPFISPLVVARCARHRLLRIALFDVSEEARGRVSAQSRRLSPMVCDDDEGQATGCQSRSVKSRALGFAVDARRVPS